MQKKEDNKKELGYKRTHFLRKWLAIALERQAKRTVFIEVLHSLLIFFKMSNLSGLEMT